jgi:hypothetical protein
MHKSFLNFEVIQHSLVITDVCLLSMQRDGTNIKGRLRVKDVIVRHGWHPSGVVPKHNSRFGLVDLPDKGVKEIYRVVRGCHLGWVLTQFGATSNKKALASV